MIKWVLVLLLLLVCLPVGADEIWQELMPDHGGIALQLFRNAGGQLDGSVLAMGSWKLGGSWECDLWGVSPPAFGISKAVFSPDRFLGIGHDGTRTGNKWYDQFVLYGKMPVEF